MPSSPRTSVREPGRDRRETGADLRNGEHRSTSRTLHRVVRFSREQAAPPEIGSFLVDSPGVSPAGRCHRHVPARRVSRPRGLCSIHPVSAHLPLRALEGVHSSTLDIAYWPGRRAGDFRLWHGTGVSRGPGPVDCPRSDRQERARYCRSAGGLRCRKGPAETHAGDVRVVAGAARSRSVSRRGTGPPWVSRWISWEARSCSSIRSPSQPLFAS